MKIHNNTKVIESYRDADVVMINANASTSMYYSVAINGELSDHCLASVKACKNVIDTYERTKR